jgi:hypothetical protein
MPGPVPKNPIIRQRRNRISTNSTLDGVMETRKRMPSLSNLGGKKKWDPKTIAWWKDVWHSPMAEEFVDTDKHALFRLALLIDQYWELPNKELAAEIRLEQQAFGLTPIDRRRLGWSVKKDNGKKRESTAKVVIAPPVDPNKDPRHVLTWVMPDAGAEDSDRTNDSEG